MPRPLKNRYAQPRVVGAVETARTAGNRSGVGLISIPASHRRRSRPVGGGWTAALPNARASSSLSYCERSGSR